MLIADKVKDVVKNTPEGVILTVADFGINPESQQALVVSLSRLVRSGELKKVSKGRYYKPRNSMFGTLGPSQSEIAKDFLVKGGVVVGYITGTTAFASMGLTTQITSTLMIGTSKYRRSVKRGDATISFLSQSNPITEDNIPLLRILDAIRLFREIPAITPDYAIIQIAQIIAGLPSSEKDKLIKLSDGYTSYVRAILGAILEFVGSNRETILTIRRTLNGTTNYKLPITETALPTKRNWNII